MEGNCQEVGVRSGLAIVGALTLLEGGLVNCITKDRSKLLTLDLMAGGT